MAGNLISALTADAKRRREKAERAAAATPPEQVAAHNACIAVLVELEPPAALAVVTRIQRSIAEFIAVKARG